MNSSIAVSVNNLTYSNRFHFRAKNTLQEISFNLPVGECLALVGQNGTGKTTTLQLLAGLLKPDHGEILIHGIDLKKNPLLAKSSIGFLPDQIPSNPSLTVNEYLQYIARLRKIPKTNQSKTIEHWCSVLNLNNYRNRLIGVLSKGQKQRVGMAQALLHNPTVLLLDEPTQGLDQNQIESFITLMLNYKKQAAIIISTHSSMEIEALSNHQLHFHPKEINSHDRDYCPA